MLEAKLMLLYQCIISKKYYSAEGNLQNLHAGACFLFCLSGLSYLSLFCYTYFFAFLNTRYSYLSSMKPLTSLSIVIILLDNVDSTDAICLFADFVINLPIGMR